MPPLFTVGYQGRTLDEVLGALRASGVRLVLDVRALPLSRKPGFSKRQLAAGLDEAGLGYLHLRGLGTPKEGRQAARAGRPELLDAIYRAQIETPEARHDLALAVELAAGARGPVCLLCFERTHRLCHRRLVAERVSAATGQTVHHLAEADAVG